MQCQKFSKTQGGSHYARPPKSLITQLWWSALHMWNKSQKWEKNPQNYQIQILTVGHAKHAINIPIWSLVNYGDSNMSFIYILQCKPSD